jgi:Trypsin
LKHARTSVVVGALMLAGWGGGCASGDPSGPTHADDRVGRTSAPIQGGADDTTHAFAVGVVQLNGMTVAICSGVLLGPNLVATARHCVSHLSSQTIDCATSKFMGTLPVTDFYVTADPQIAHSSTYARVSNIAVPADTNVCGNDIALLTLEDPGGGIPASFTQSQYVTPVLNPPMTNHGVYSTTVTAIGYGVSSIEDADTAGTRRILENVRLGCIPGDSAFVDCYSNPVWQQFITPKEFEGGDGTCEGDSGSGAFDQRSFDKGNWVAFGVLSRGGIDAEGGTCSGSIYTRFDQWSDLIVSAATQAATLGKYPLPAWAGGTSCVANGTSCGSDNDCCSVNCLSFDNGGTYACTACDDNDPCAAGYGCVSGKCVAGATSTTGTGAPIVADAGELDSGQAAAPKHAGGCSVAAVGVTPAWGGLSRAAAGEGGEGGDRRGGLPVGAGLGALALAVAARRRLVFFARAV